MDEQNTQSFAFTLFLPSRKSELGLQQTIIFFIIDLIDKRLNWLIF